MRYFSLLVAFLGSLLLLVSFLFPGKGPRRDWRSTARALAGIFGMAFVGLDLYGATHTELQHYYIFHSAKGNLAGLSLGILISLLLDFFANKRTQKGVGGNG